jgi:hypothetical protein
MTNVVELKARREDRDLPNMDEDRMIEARHQINHSMTIVRDRGYSAKEIAEAMGYFISLGEEEFAKHCESILVREPMRHDPGTFKALKEIVASEEFGWLTDWEINFVKSMVATIKYNSRLTPRQHTVAYRIVQKVRAGRARDSSISFLITG